MPRPTHNVTLARKTKDGEKARFNRIGVAWENDRGMITIVLDPGVYISWRDMNDCYLNLFPNTGEERPSRRSKPVDDDPLVGVVDNFGDEDIPF